MGTYATMTPAQKARRLVTNEEWRQRNPEKHKAQMRRYRERNPEYGRKATLRESGFTLEMFDRAVAQQHNRCAICRTDLQALKSSLVHADHDHATGAPRGVLCHNCNVGLGLFTDSPERLLAAVAYLEHPTLGPD